MKKLLAILLCLTMLLTLTACGIDDAEKTAPSTGASQPTTGSEPSTAPTDPAPTEPAPTEPTPTEPTPTEPTPTEPTPTEPEPTEPTPTEPTDPPAPPACSHSYREATCVDPKTCTKCGETEGDALGHAYQAGFCARCGEKDADYCQLTDGDWYYISAPAESWADSLFSSLSFEKNTWHGRFYITYDAYLALPDVPDWWMTDYDLDEIQQGWDLVEANGNTYAILTFAQLGMGKFEVSEDVASGIITLTFDKSTSHDGSIWSMTLKRISGNQLELTACVGDVLEEYYQVGNVFTCCP